MHYYIGSSGDSHWHKCNAKTLHGAKILCSKLYIISLCGMLQVGIMDNGVIITTSSKRGYNKWVDKV